MDQSRRIVSENLQAAYDQQYTDEMTEWRELGAKYKAANIQAVCRDYTFATVLECGAGEGSILKFLDAFNVFPELSAIEISDTGISQIRERNLRSVKEIKKFSGYEIPYLDKTFDMAYCSHVLEHVEHPRTLLRELKRVSRFQVFEVPLDYSIDVDRQVNHLLSYGHINVYTPSLFKFLLASEGYEIINDLLTRIEPEVVRYLWRKKMDRKSRIVGELRLRLSPIRQHVRRLINSKARYEEYGYAAYTCLARGVSGLKAF